VLPSRADKLFHSQQQKAASMHIEQINLAQQQLIKQLDIDDQPRVHTVNCEEDDAHDRTDKQRKLIIALQAGRHSRFATSLSEAPLQDNCAIEGAGHYMANIRQVSGLLHDTSQRDGAIDGEHII